MDRSLLKNKLLKILIVGDILLVNLGVGYLLYQNQNANLENRNYISNIRTDECGDGCREYIDEKIGRLEMGLAKSTPYPLEVPDVTITPKLTAKVTVSKKARREEILTIPGTGSTIANDWSNLAGTEFYFDARDYLGLTEVYFEANMKLFNGNGTAYVRLFDVTNGIGVSGSENNTASQTDVWTKSQKVYFWAGKNLIRVQARSLTADTTVYNQGRLRIVTEN